MSTLHSRGSPMPRAGRKIKSGPQQRGTKCEVAAPPLSYRGPKSGRKCKVTPAFSGIPNIVERNLKWLPHPCLLGGPKESRSATSPLHYQGSPTASAGSKIRNGPQQRGTKCEVAASPLPSRGPKRGRQCYVATAFSGLPKAKRGEQNQKWSPTKGSKIKRRRLTPVCSGAQKRVEMQRHPYILGDPQHRGTKSEVAASTLPSQGPKRGPKCYVNPAFSGIPNAKRGEQNQKWSPTKGNKIRRSCLTPAFSGAQKRAEMGGG